MARRHETRDTRHETRDLSALSPTSNLQSPAIPRAANRVASFGYAFEGIFYLIRTQRNAQIHCAIALAVIIAGLFFGIEHSDWLALAGMITLVLAAEGINTAIEAVVDLASPQRHPLAKIAKDVAAGTVLLTALGAVAVGLIVFLPRVWMLIVSLVR
jgi:diacylglycerol kinase (ATP)